MLKSADEGIELAVVLCTYATIIVNVFALVVALVAILVYLGDRLTASNLQHAIIYIGIIMLASIAAYSAIISIIRKIILD